MVAAAGLAGIGIVRASPDTVEAARPLQWACSPGRGGLLLLHVRGPGTQLELGGGFDKLRELNHSYPTAVVYAIHSCSSHQDVDRSQGPDAPSNLGKGGINNNNNRVAHIFGVVCLVHPPQAKEGSGDFASPRVQNAASTTALDKSGDPRPPV